jgi:hypothetical protein
MCCGPPRDFWRELVVLQSFSVGCKRTGRCAKLSRHLVVLCWEWVVLDGRRARLPLRCPGMKS